MTEFQTPYYSIVRMKRKVSKWKICAYHRSMPVRINTDQNPAIDPKYRVPQVSGTHKAVDLWPMTLTFDSQNDTITNSVLNSPCFAWHPYGKLELFKTELVIIWLNWHLHYRLSWACGLCSVHEWRRSIVCLAPAMYHSGHALISFPISIPAFFWRTTLRWSAPIWPLQIGADRLNKHCTARPCKWPQPYDPDFGLSMSHLFGICHKGVWVPT